jgi:hypothetical protein
MEDIEEKVGMCYPFFLYCNHRIEFFSGNFETDLFVSVVSIWIRNTETNRNKPKKYFIGFAKQTEKEPKQDEFRFVSVRTEIFFVLFRGHPSGEVLDLFTDF